MRRYKNLFESSMDGFCSVGDFPGFLGGKFSYNMTIFLVYDEDQWIAIDIMSFFMGSSCRYDIRLEVSYVPFALNQSSLS